MDESGGAVSVVLFSGTDDKLTSAAILIAGAAALGRKVNVFVQYWALEAFQRDSIDKDHGVVSEAGVEGASYMRLMLEQNATPHWAETLRQARDIGDVSIHACAASMEMFGLAMEDLDPMVDGVWGVAAFLMEADGPIVHI